MLLFKILILKDKKLHKLFLDVNFNKIQILRFWKNILHLYQLHFGLTFIAKGVMHINDIGSKFLYYMPY